MAAADRGFAAARAEIAALSRLWKSSPEIWQKQKGVPPTGRNSGGDLQSSGTHQAWQARWSGMMVIAAQVTIIVLFSLLLLRAFLQRGLPQVGGKLGPPRTFESEAPIPACTRAIDPESFKDEIFPTRPESCH